MVYAVDFDGTLVENEYPDIGAPRKDIIAKVIELQQAGNKIILWTCREGKNLYDAIKFLYTFGLCVDSINSNLADYGDNALHKIWADYYVDDKSLRPEEL